MEMKLDKAKAWVKANKKNILITGTQVAAAGGIVYGIHQLLKDGNTETLDKAIEIKDEVEASDSLLDIVTYIGGSNAGEEKNGGAWIMHLCTTTLEDNVLTKHTIEEAAADILNGNFYIA